CALPISSQMGDEHSIVVDPRLDGRGTVMAQALLEHLGTGGEIKADALGNPKLGMLTPKTVKACAPLFQATRVDGRPPVSAATLNRLVARIELADCLDALDVAWPATVVPPEDTLGERLAWHTTELQVLDKLMAFAERIDRMSERLGTLGVGELDWASTSDVDSIRDCLALVNAERQQVAQAEPLRDLERALEAVDMPTHPSPIARALASAVRQRDTSLYTGALDEAAQLKALLDRRDRRDSLLAEVTNVSASMASQLSEESPDDLWTARLSVMDQAWAWRYAVAWLTRTRTENVNQLQVAIRAEEDRMRVAVARIAAHLAWAKSVGRLKQSQISDLVQYTQLVKKLGKGTGKYAARQQDEIRKVLARCTDSVPVWIVPLHRVATQFRVEPELFDVVIVDEASQAGLDATFLQFLGRKIVVVGDDKQVSPTVIIDHSSVHQLAAHYLADSPYAATWSDPERSLFDEARAKYHDLVTLVEHRRCVPDIIGFSNEIAYEPEGIRLIPVRETGSSALDPVIPVFVDNGFVEGTTSARRNRPEARALVDSIKACIADDRYSGMTMGVISLLGEAQARLIESLLLDEVGPVEIAKRELRCGVAAVFQGAERDVMFLSMVAATDDDNRFAAQTKETATQRYNVAVSRAKDQVWVFHSEPLANLANPQDLRRRLLEYAGRVNMRRGSGVPGATQGLAPDDVLITPFGSVFEQRVHNRLFERGYIVVPQYESLGYRIDLVVVGERGKLAIECDGDHWHGPERYLADLARQRDLERCGWRFFRLRESDFNVDRHRSLEALWPMLQALDTPVATFPAHLGTPSAALAANSQAPDLGLSGHGTLNDPKPPVTALKQTGSSESALTDPEIASQERPDPAAFLPGALVSESADTGSGNPISLRGQPRRAGLLFLAPYAEWTSATRLPEALQARPDQLAESLLDIVQTEGPILGDRVMHLYLRASGGLRLGKALAARLASALERLERDGQVLIDNPTRTYNRGQQTYRTPNQPLVHMRERGPRTLYEIPQLELRELMGRLEDQQGLSDQALWRATVNSYGLTRLEEKTVS
ncbi:MAG: hypothetical protein QG597_5302, partial [Actinomycetota bacterium]|nr:hypothetical protein [Actinomycetota bacterium]